jgi:hypothetical protein
LSSEEITYAGIVIDNQNCGHCCIPPVFVERDGLSVLKIWTPSLSKTLAEVTGRIVSLSSTSKVKQAAKTAEPSIFDSIQSTDRDRR